jgi:hypothetical protein
MAALGLLRFTSGALEIFRPESPSSFRHEPGMPSFGFVETTTEKPGTLTQVQ